MSPRPCKSHAAWGFDLKKDPWAFQTIRSAPRSLVPFGPTGGPERLRRPQRLALRQLTRIVSDFVLRGIYARETVDWADFVRAKTVSYSGEVGAKAPGAGAPASSASGA